MTLHVTAMDLLLVPMSLNRVILLKQIIELALPCNRSICTHMFLTTEKLTDFTTLKMLFVSPVTMLDDPGINVLLNT